VADVQRLPSYQSELKDLRSGHGGAFGVRDVLRHRCLYRRFAPWWAPAVGQGDRPGLVFGNGEPVARRAPDHSGGQAGAAMRGLVTGLWQPLQVWVSPAKVCKRMECRA